MGLRIEYLHCIECRLPSTPSGRRVLEYPGAAGASVARICEMATQWWRLSAMENALQPTSIAPTPGERLLAGVRAAVDRAVGMNNDITARPMGSVAEVYMAAWSRDYVPVPWTSWVAHDGCRGAPEPKTGCPWDRGNLDALGWDA